jgi:hypothetical protein
MPLPNHQDYRAMNLTFVKRTGKFDDLVITRSNGVPETIACPKQGIIPHDMVHYAVESVLAHRGFLSLVKDGSAASFAATGGDSEEAIERLVETFQAEMWGGRVRVADLIATYEHACAARAHGVAPVTPDAIEAIRLRLDELTKQWSELAPGEPMQLAF